MKTVNEKKRKKPRSESKKVAIGDKLFRQFNDLVREVSDDLIGKNLPVFRDDKVKLGKDKIVKRNEFYVIIDESDNEVSHHILLHAALLTSYCTQTSKAALLSKVREFETTYDKSFMDCLHIKHVIQEHDKNKEYSKATALFDKYRYAKEKNDYSKHRLKQVCRQLLSDR